MRLLVGVALQGRVIEMALPAAVPVAHLMPEVLAAVEAEAGRAATGQVAPRRVSGEWLDLELSLSQQGCESGSLICLEECGGAVPTPHHDPVVEIAERGPPLELLPDGAAPVVVGAVLGALVAASIGNAAVVLVAAAPVAWAALPLLGGMATGPSSRWVPRMLGITSAGVGGMAIAASGVVASLGATGVGLDGCVAVAVLVHIGRRRSTAALLRVVLGALEWWLVGAVLPLAVFVAGWSGW